MADAILETNPALRNLIDPAAGIETPTPEEITTFPLPPTLTPELQQQPTTLEPTPLPQSQLVDVSEDERDLLDAANDIRQNATLLEDFERAGGVVTEGGPVGLRAALSFTSTPEQENAVLEQHFGKGMFGKLESGELWFINRETGDPTLIEDLSTEKGTLLPGRFSTPGIGDVADVAGALPEAVLGTAGEIGGLALGGPPGAVAGAALGGAAGTGLREVIGRALGVPARPTGEVVKEAGLNALLSGILTAPTAGFKRTVGGTTLTKGAKEASEVFASVGARLTPGAQTENRIVDIVENIASAAIGAPKKFTTLKASAPAAVPKLVDNIVTSFGPNAVRQEGRIPVDVFNEMLRNALNDGQAIAKSIYQPIYKQIDEAVAGSVLVRGDRIKTSFRDMLEDTLRVPSDISEVDIRKAFGEKIGQAFTQIDIMRPGGVNFQTGQQTISNLSALTAKATPQEKRVIAKTIAIVENEMKEAADKAGPQIFRQYKKARAIAFQSNKMFNDSFLASAARNEGSLLGEQVFSLRNAKQARELRSVIVRAARPGERGVRGKMLRDFQAGYSSAAWDAAQDEATGIFSGRKMLNFLDDLGSSGRGRVISELFPGKAAKELVGNWRVVAEAIEFSQRKPISAGSGMFQLAQGGALIGALSTGNAAAAVPIILGPSILGYILANKKTARLLAEGFNVTPRTAAALSFTNRFLAAMNRKEILEGVNQSVKFISNTSKDFSKGIVREIRARRGVE